MRAPDDNEDPFRKMLLDALFVALFVVPSIIVLIWGVMQVASR